MWMSCQIELYPNPSKRQKTQIHFIEGIHSYKEQIVAKRLFRNSQSARRRYQQISNFT
jgi:hypothetical protein